jgi:ribosome biogenesis GTPase A
MKKAYWDVVNKILRNSDLILEVLDARFIEETRNHEIEEKVRKYGRKIIYVINKCDLVPIEELHEAKKTLTPCVFVSAINKLGVTILRKTILKTLNRPTIRIGVVGYPNTGKSSLINALKGRKSAKTSPVPGYTKHEQWVRVDNRIMMVDTPGVIPFKEKEPLKHVLISAIDYRYVDSPDMLAIELIKIYKGRIELYYGVKMGDDAEKTLEEITLKNRRLKKGGEADVETMARIMIKDWQAGKIRKAGIVKTS